MYTTNRSFVDQRPCPTAPGLHGYSSDLFDDSFPAYHFNRPPSPQEICCSPSSDPFTSHQDSELVVVSPKDIQPEWPMQNDSDTFMLFQSYPSRFSYNVHNIEHFNKPRSKSVDMPVHRSFGDFENMSDDEDSMSMSQSQFYMELTEEDQSVDEDMSIEDDDESIELDYSVYNSIGDVSDETCESPYDITDINVTLNVSKTPCLDALIFCLTMRLGAHQTRENKMRGEIVVTDALKFLNGIHYFCPKKSQTQNDEARIKALKRWFDGIPAKRKRNQPFIMRIKPNKFNDVKKIMKKMTKFVVAKGLLPVKSGQSNV